MSPTNDTKVLIGGNVYTLSGDESEEYIQRVALYINNKLNDIQDSENAKKLNTRLLSVLLEINIADDYFKEKERANHLEKVIEEKDKKIASLENELKSLQQQLQQTNGNHKRELSQNTEIINQLKKEAENYKQELNEYIELFDQETIKE